MAYNNHVPPFPETLEDVLNQMGRHQPILQLDLHDLNFDISALELNRLVDEHRQLRVLKLSDCLLTTADVIMVIRGLDSLRLFQFRVNDHNDLEQLRQQLNNAWEIDMRHEFDDGSMKIRLSRQL